MKIILKYNKEYENKLAEQGKLSDNEEIIFKHTGYTYRENKQGLGFVVYLLDIYQLNNKWEKINDLKLVWKQDFSFINDNTFYGIKNNNINNYSVDLDKHEILAKTRQDFIKSYLEY